MPIVQMGGKCTPVPFSKDLEKNSIPNANDCVSKILEVMKS